jgi:hypothetical protein
MRDDEQEQEETATENMDGSIPVPEKRVSSGVLRHSHYPRQAQQEAEA